jgi:serine/threonine protein kinase
MTDIEQNQSRNGLYLPIKKRKIRDTYEVIIIKFILGNNISDNDERIRFEIVTVTEFLKENGKEIRKEIRKEKKIMYFNNEYVCEITNLGKGAFGVVLKVIHKGKEYAIKIASSLDILFELTYIDELNENGGSEYVISSIKPVISYDGISALIMPFYDTDLRHIINSKQFLSNAHIKCILENILKGLAHTHSLDIIHCDIKPANILVQGNPLKCILADYGISKKVGENIGDHSCTRWYRPPEIIEGEKYSFPADMWGVGCIIYELVTGDVLFKGGPCGHLSYDDDKHTHLNIEGGVWDLINKNLLSNNASKMLGLTIRIKDFDIQLLNLFQKCIEFDPTNRISAKDALKHRFFTN